MPLRLIKISLALCPLLLALCSVPACKKPTEPKAVLPDTTSHDFVFELDTLGNGSSSVLNDVCIIDENNIWAVGEIYVQDSTGQAEEVYNAVHWDGKKWNLKKVPVRDLGGFTFITPLKAVIGFSPNDVWVAGDADLIRWNGSFWSGKALFITDLSFNGQVLKMWGTSGSNIYCVGRNGAIYHYNGSTWQKLLSGTTVDIQDIWGAVEEKTGEQTVLAVASFRAAVPQAKQLLRIQNETVLLLSDNGLPFDLSGVWFMASSNYYVVGDGVFYTNELGNSWQADTTHPLVYKDAVRGVAPNDIFLAGSFGLISHYNGASWKHYAGKDAPSFFGRYKSVSYNGRIMAAVGWLGDRAVIIRGSRN